MAEKKAQSQAKKKAAPRKPRKKAEKILVDDTSAWSFYRAKGLVKVGEFRDGYVLVMSEDGKVKKMETDAFLAEYEPVKGLHKGFF